MLESIYISMLNSHIIDVLCRQKKTLIEVVVTRSNRKDARNQRVIRRYTAILKRMGSVKLLTPNYEIYEEIANEFAIEPVTVSRIITKSLGGRN